MPGICVNSKYKKSKCISNYGIIRRSKDLFIQNRRKKMADQKTIDKVKELLEGHCYGPLKEAAEKWLEIADEKYDVKEKAAKAKDAFDDAVDAVKENAGPAWDKAKEKAGEAFDKIQDTDTYKDLQGKAEPYLEKVKEKADPALEKLAEMELVKQLKEGVATLTENIEFFSTDKGAEVVGSKEAAEQIKAHAEAMKAEGKEYCDCEACTKAREILKDLGEDIGE